MAKDNYWRNRELEHIKKNKKSDAQIAKAITSNQRQTMKEIEQQIEAFYGRYASTEGITMAEARKRVSKLDIDDYAAKAKRYVKGARSNNQLTKAQSFTDKANEEMRIYNVTMKINRLELLKANVALELAAMTSDEERFMLDNFTKDARKEYERQAGILGHSLNYNEKSIAKIVNSSFLNATWSDRLWTNQQALKGELNKLLNRGIVQGKNPKALARDLRRTFGSSVANSERLMRTEMARIQTEVLLDSMTQLELTQYEWIAEPGACKLCAGLDGKIFDLKDMVYGFNAVPLHPYCRCSIVGVIDREAFEKDLDKRGLFAEDETEEFTIKSPEDARRLLVEKGGFVNVEDSFLKVNDKAQVDNIKQLLVLEEKFGAAHKSKSVSIAGVEHNANAFVNTPVTNPYRQTLSLSPNYYGSSRGVIDSTKKRIESGWSMPAKMTDEVLSVYTVTHEYGHIIQNGLVGDLMKERGWDPENSMNMFDAKKKTQKAQMRFYTKTRIDMEREHIKEISDIAKETDPKFDLQDHISRYGKTNGGEFFAETFANSQLGAPNALGKAMNIWLERKGLIKNDD